MNCPQCQQPTTSYYRHEKRHASSVEAYTKQRCPGCGWTCNVPAPTVRAFPGPGDRYVVARQERRASQRIAATYRRGGPPVRFKFSYAEVPSKRCESPGCEGLHPNGLDSDPLLKGWVCLAKHEPEFRREYDCTWQNSAAPASKFLPPDADGLEWAREDVTGWWGAGREHTMAEAYRSLCRMSKRESVMLTRERVDMTVISRDTDENGSLTATDAMPVLRHAIREHLPRIRRETKGEPSDC